MSSSECRTLWMGDIQPHWSEDYISSLFGDLGEEIEVKLIRDKVTGYLSGYGFVEFKSHDAARAALERYNGQLVTGTAVRYRLNWGAGGQRIESPPEYSIFVGDLGTEVTDVALRQIFADVYETVLGAKIVTDLATGTSKGFGFVRFSSEADRDAAFSMHGTLCMGRPIRVAPATKRATALSNGSSGTPEPAAHERGGGADGGAAVAAAAAAAAAIPGGDPSNTTIFVGGLSDAVVEDVLHAAFQGAGRILYVKIPPGRGCGFVSFAERGAAEAALRDLQGTDIGGCKVRLSWGKSHRERATAALGGLPHMALSLDPMLAAQPMHHLAPAWPDSYGGTPGSYGMDAGGGVYGFERPGPYAQGAAAHAAAVAAAVAAAQQQQQQQQPIAYYTTYPHFLGYGPPQHATAAATAAHHHAGAAAPPPPGPPQHIQQHAQPMLLSQAQHQHQQQQQQQRQQQQPQHIIYTLDGSATAAAAGGGAGAAPPDLALSSYGAMYALPPQPQHSSPVMMAPMQTAFPLGNTMDGSVIGVTLRNGGGGGGGASGAPGDGGMLGSFAMNTGYRGGGGGRAATSALKQGTVPGQRGADGWRAVGMPRARNRGGGGGGARGGGGGNFSSMRNGGTGAADARSKSGSPNQRQRGRSAAAPPPPPMSIVPGQRSSGGAPQRAPAGMEDVLQAARALSISDMDSGAAVCAVGAAAVAAATTAAAPVPSSAIM